MKTDHLFRKLSTDPDMLGETPLWDWRSDRLYWIDSVGMKLCIADQRGEGRVDHLMPSKIGSIGLVADAPERIVVALADGVYVYDLGERDFSCLFKLPDNEVSVRFNDGKVDRYGNFLVGTLTIGGEGKGKLYRIRPDGAADVLKTGITVPNAICFTPDGGGLYFADSVEGCVKLYDYPPEAEALGEARQVLDTAALGSAPDGACVDRDGNFWVTLVQNGRIARFAPDGALAEVIETPVDTPSCVAFGGADQSVIYLTSIKDTGTGRVVSHPDGGHLFALEETGFIGRNDYLFREERP